MLVASSNIVAIVYPSTLYEIRCRDGKPRKFGFLVRPTLESYNEFVLLLDKMI